jgi:hypothetical protein
MAQCDRGQNTDIVADRGLIREHPLDLRTEEFEGDVLSHSG